MDLMSWFGRGGRLVSGTRRRASNGEADDHFRQRAKLELLKELEARGLKRGDRLDLSHDWNHLTAQTRLRQGDFAAAAGVLVKRICLRHSGAGMFEFILTDNGAAALDRLRSGDRIGLEAMVGLLADHEPARRASASPETTEIQRALETDLAREFAAGFDSVDQGSRIAWREDSAN